MSDSDRAAKTRPENWIPRLEFKEPTSAVDQIRPSQQVRFVRDSQDRRELLQAGFLHEFALRRGQWIQG